jgi:HTH-type transcriptional regulator, competence development regulator
MTRKPGESRATPNTLGQYLTDVRAVKRLTLREVEEATGHEVSNAYLSQLETGKISKPSPNVLHALATVYGVRYEDLMEKAGYISPNTAAEPRSPDTAKRRHGRVPTFANEELTQEEEVQLLEYLAFLRSRRGHREKS